MTDCALCGESDFDAGRRYEGIHLCRDCYRFVEANDGETGRIQTEKCRACGHLKKVRFVVYKKRGRPPGSKNAPRARPEAPLTRFAPTVEEARP